MNAICPFCGLLCDDLMVRRNSTAFEVVSGGCPISTPAFARPVEAAAAQPRIQGQPASLAQAARAAAEILRGAALPLIAGLATDVAGMRAVMSLADRCGAVLDHMNAAAKFRNLLVLQDSGWITTTLAEVKNRADLVIFAGTSAVNRFPRFAERFLWNRETLFGLDPAKREIVYLGRDLDGSAGIAPDGREPTRIPCDTARLGEAFGILRALLAGRRLQAKEAGGVPLDALQSLLERMKAARYTVIVWAAADLDFPHAELTVRQLCEFVKELNKVTRAAGLPLGGSDGDFTADGVELWQTGYPFRTAFGAGAPAYDPYHLATTRLLQSGEGDALMWIAGIDDQRLPPPTDAPTIVLGNCGMNLPSEPQVFIPVGTPGLDHAGHLLRADKVVALHLPKLRDAGLPSVAEAVTAIERAL